MKYRTIPSSIDDLDSVLEVHYRLFNQGIIILENILENLDTLNTSQTENFKVDKHRHNFHKHSSIRGHKVEDRFVTNGNHGKFYICNALGFKTLLEVLMAESKSGEDFDKNGLRYYHDFVFDWNDNNVPVALRRQAKSFHMPGSPKYPYRDPETKEKIRTSFDTKVIGHDSNSKTIEIERDRRCLLLSWNEYLATLPTPFKFNQLR